MRRGRRDLLLLLGATALAPLGACHKKPPPPPPAPPPPPPPTLVSMAVKAAPDVNPDLSGAPQPVRVRVFQLTSPDRLNQVTYFQLDKDPKTALGDTFKAMEERVLRPGETWSYRAKPDDTVRFVGVVASYQDIDHARWHAAKDFPRNATTFLDADVGAKAVTIKDAAP